MKLAVAVGLVLAGAGAVAWAGGENGPGRTSRVLGGYSSQSYSVRFVAGEPAVVGVEGDGDSDLDLYVYDANGNLIASDDDDTELCLVRWYPRWTGRYTIKVVNRGYLANAYTIVHN